MYNFKFKQEVVWVVLVAAGTVVLQALVDFDPMMSDYKVWAIGIGAGIIRAASAAALVGFGKMIAAMNSLTDYE